MATREDDVQRAVDCEDEICRNYMSVIKKAGSPTAPNVGLVLDGQSRPRPTAPSRAADLCEECWEARDHFDHARRLRVRSFILANLGLAESVVGALRLEDARAVGTAHAAVGGVFMTWAAERESKVRREVAAAVEAYNRCKLHRTF